MVFYHSNRNLRQWTNLTRVREGRKDTWKRKIKRHLAFPRAGISSRCGQDFFSLPLNSSHFLSICEVQPVWVGASLPYKKAQCSFTVSFSYLSWGLFWLNITSISLDREGILLNNMNIPYPHLPFTYIAFCRCNLPIHREWSQSSAEGGHKAKVWGTGTLVIKCRWLS